ncbi:MAG: hypothetical protein M0Z98_05190 [Actinomycetales bacterium]|nr:hypothetical protein [Actinomycetales bacterium]
MHKRRAAIAAVAIAIGTAIASAGPAVAGTGQAYPGPGFTSSHSSCVGAGLDFSAHYGVNGGSYPTITHGAVGPWVSADATGDAPGTVGAVNSAVAKVHGAIDRCFP